MKPYYQSDSITIYNADCLEVMREMADNCVDAVITDPPYYRVKSEPWDRQWDTPAAFLTWIGELGKEWQRLLKPNGSLYVFASSQMSARVECKIGEVFNVLNRITWRKEDAAHKQAETGALRSYFPQTESIIFAEHYGADSMALGESGYAAQCERARGFVFDPLRAYLDGERRAAGIDKIACNVACGFSAAAGGMAARHYFGTSQWQLPTAEHYAALRRLFNPNGTQYLRREYEYLRREYEDLRREYEDLRRPFAVTADVPYTDVWDFPTVGGYRGKHPCEKPLALMRHIITTSTRPGDITLDCFMGSGATGVAALEEGRRFVGVESAERWCERAAKRMGQAILGFNEVPLFATAGQEATE
jgi:adenine-specific DNA-methyltransferase